MSKSILYSIVLFFLPIGGWGQEFTLKTSGNDTIKVRILCWPPESSYPEKPIVKTGYLIDSQFYDCIKYKIKKEDVITFQKQYWEFKPFRLVGK